MLILNNNNNNNIYCIVCLVTGWVTSGDGLKIRCIIKPLNVYLTNIKIYYNIYYMSELILYFLGLFLGFNLSVFLLLSNDKINKYIEDKKLMNEINIFYNQILNDTDKTEEQKKEDMINFVYDKIKIN